MQFFGHVRLSIFSEMRLVTMESFEMFNFLSRCSVLARASPAVLCIPTGICVLLKRVDLFPCLKLLVPILMQDASRPLVSQSAF